MTFCRKKSVQYNQYKQADKMNGVGRLHMQLHYPWLNSFLFEQFCQQKSVEYNP